MATQKKTKTPSLVLEICKSLNRWRESPLLYLDEALGIPKIWKLQSELMVSCVRAIEEHKQIYVASGHGLGKDYICAAIGLWFLDCFTPSKVIFTGPTDRQVKNVMWAEILNKWNNRKITIHGKAYTTPYLEIRKEDWFMLGFTTKDTGAAADAQGGKFQGFHGSNLCVIVSEAQAVEDNIYDQVDAVATGEHALVIYIGNPTRARGRFAQGLRDSNRNIVFNFSCLENPNYLKKQEIIPGLASYEWVEDKRLKWGENDPRWIGRVLGQIPDQALNNTFPLSIIKHMQSRFGLLSQHVHESGVAVDPAGEGVDDNVIMAGRGGEPVYTFTKTNMTPTEIAIKAVDLCRQVNGHFIIIDCDGMGIRDYQELCAMPESFLAGIQIIKFHGSAASTEKDGERALYANQRAEASFVAAERGKAGKAAVDPQDIELMEDLQEEEYFTNGRGLLQIEDKKDIKDRLGRSPGRGDAWKMLQWAFAQGIRDDRRTEQQDTERNRMPAYATTDDDTLIQPKAPQYALT